MRFSGAIGTVFIVDDLGDLGLGGEALQRVATEEAVGAGDPHLADAAGP